MELWVIVGEGGVKVGGLFLSFYKGSEHKKNIDLKNAKTLVQSPMQFVVSVTYQNAKTYKRKRNKRTPIRAGLRFGLHVRACIYVYYPPDTYF